MNSRRTVVLWTALWGLGARALSTAPNIRNYVDVHCHLTHCRFQGEEDIVANRARISGLEYCVVNGLDPASNREVLQLCSRHSHLLPAVGIYPLDAAASVITPDMWSHLPERFTAPARFDTDAEIDFIDQAAARGEVVAVGECGLDRFYLSDDSFLVEQERVLRMLLRVSVKHDLPVILHSRKAEARVFEMLIEEGVSKAIFHCYSGKIKLALKIAEAGYMVSIPSVVERADSFRQLAKKVPMDSILTETDSPYMSPDKGVRNEPATIPRGLKAIAAVKNMTPEEAADAVRCNFSRVFGL
ncbi:unnamed protein product [Choristocarpus tenellus]